MMPIRMTKPAAAAIALALGLSLGACASQPTNRSLYSVKQPVVERQSFALDLNTNGGGLSIPEQRRLNAWFESLGVGYGDRISVDDPLTDEATRNAIAEIASRHGLLLSEGAPVTEGFLSPGQARVIVTRSNAYVPGCPDWEGRATYNYNNGTNPGFGCAINGNLAAMVADPEHLIHGAEGTGETVIMTSNKAIASYRAQSPSGEGGLTSNSTQSGGGGGSN